MKRVCFLGCGIVVLAAIVLVVSGCSKSSNMMKSGSLSPRVLAVSPADGTSGVPVSTTINVFFPVPMDTGSVQANLCIFGGDQMQMMMDSIAGMHSGMDYSRIMGMMHEMSMTGHLGWNSNQDSCQFWPDSAMHANTQYMIFMGRDVMMVGRYMGDQNQMMGSDWISHFTTSP